MASVYSIALALLVFCGAANAKPTATIQTAGDCKAYALATQRAMVQLKDVPRVRVIVVCSDVLWHRLQAKADAERTNTAFTNIRERLTVLRGSVTEDPIELRRVLAHEFDHIRCQCSLGE